MGIDVSTAQGIIIFLLTTIWFMAAVGIGLILPGRLLLKRYMEGESAGRKAVIYTGFGMVLWTIQAYVFGVLHIRWVSYIYLAVCVVCSLPWITTIPKMWRHTTRKLFSIPWWVIVLLVIGVTVQTMQAIPSGVITRQGWYTFIADDTLWHLGLTGELILHVPPFQPGTVGLLLTNYHYLSNLFMADFSRVFGIPFVTAQFLYIYVLISALLGLLLFAVARMAGVSVLGSAIIMYLQYFASDIIYVIPLITRHVIDFSVHPLEDGTMFLENPPRAFASVCTLVGLILLMKTVKFKRIYVAMLTGLTFGIVIGFKIHTGIMVLIGLAALGLYGIISRKWVVLYTAIIAAGVSFLIYAPTNAGAGGPVFDPFEMAHMFAVQPHLAISFLVLRLQIYAAHNNVLRVLEMNLIMVVIFCVSQFGFRIAGWFGWGPARERLGTPVALFVFASLVGTTVFGTLYIQPITYADIFNSYLAASVFLSLLTGFMIERYMLKKNRLVMAGFIIVLGFMTIPRMINRVMDYRIHILHAGPTIAKNEIDTLYFVRYSLKNSGVMYVFNTHQPDGYESYVSALTGHDTFLAGQNYLARHGVPYADRQHAADVIAASRNPNVVGALLKKYNIGVLYAYKPFVMPEGLGKLNLRKVFENGENILYTYENK